MTFFLRPILLASLALSPMSAQAPASPVDDGRIKVLLISGANNHEWEWTTPSLRSILEESERFDVTVTKDPEQFLASKDRLAGFRAFVLDYNGPDWGPEARQNFVDAVRSGVGVSVVHAANNAFRGWKEYEEMVALLWRKGTGHGRFHAFDVKVTDRDHPITRGMPDMRNHPDELYHRLVNSQNSDFRLLATAHSSKKSGGTGEAEPMILVKSFGKGRIFHTPLGHVWRRVPATRASHADPQFRHLMARGTEWAATGAVTLPPNPPNFLTAEEKAAGFRLLFNGRNLKGWRGYKKDGPPAKGWGVRAASLSLPARAGAGDLMTTGQFGNFDLRFEWRVGRGSNSGVIYRIRETQGATYMTGPEYQILDDGKRQANKHSAGALYDLVVPHGKKLHPQGQWNTGRILITGGRVKHFVNGIQVVDAPFAGDEWKAMIQKSKFKRWPEFGTHPSGHIAFQDHGGAVDYRTIRIKELEK